MGIVNTGKEGPCLEATAVVSKVGSAAKNFAVGDRVIVFRSGGCFSTRMQVLAMLCAKIPDELSDEEAATVPTVYCTVIHSLINLGNLQRGQVSRFLSFIKPG
jgi:NADPH:quinone reductase-like Zn-dependent oxidoreductase